MRLRHAALVVAAGLGCLSAGSQSPEVPHGTLTLETLMHHMATTSGVRAEFHEVKQIALLEQPLESDGTLYFIPPSRLARITRAPGATTLVIDGSRMSYRDTTGGNSVDLSANREARAIVENLVVLFNGDLGALHEHYNVGFDADGARWHMRLVPKGPPVSQLIASIELRGDGPALQQMVLVEKEGDRTTTLFHDVVTDTRFSPEELRRIFLENEPVKLP
ncbi:MAG TPA: outer membrane lipoprotein carrier protein LolA [Myxococcota bacterium]|nr:outer membrane lipoprotein carrier protein LolA [Myxococcota bacterium]